MLAVGMTCLVVRLGRAILSMLLAFSVLRAVPSSLVTSSELRTLVMSCDEHTNLVTALVRY